MMHTMTRGTESSAATGYLLVAFELSQRWWKVGFTTGMGHRVRTRRIAAGALEPLAQAIADAKKMFGLAAAARVISCYEAGRDGFWLHRYLTGRGDTNYVVDSASIEVDRRARRTKTDAVDLRGLLALLARYVAGDRRCWRVVRVPSVADEDARQLHRTWETLQGDRTRVINRLKAVLASHGVQLAITADFLGAGDGHARVGRECHPAGGVRAPDARLGAVATHRGTGGGGESRARSPPDRSGHRDRPCGAGAPTGAGDRGGWRVGFGDGDFWVARDPKWTGARRARRIGAGAVSEWGDAARSRDYAGGQCARAAHDGATGVGLAAMAIRQCAGAVVSAPLCHRRIAAAAHWDRRVGAETSDRPVALRGSSYRA
jgi:hypothetical protein